MKNIVRQLKFTICVSVAAVLGQAGCSAAPTIDSSDALMQSSAESTRPVVFGKFRLIRNGTAANLGSGPFSDSASLRVSSLDGAFETVQRVGDDGEFTLALEPGEYLVTGIGFYNRGERVETDVSLAFLVPDEASAVYIGTMTLETVFDSGYYGLNGAVEGFNVSDDCGSDCADRLTQLDLSTDAAIVALIREESHVASAD